jgi:hypothetical protein
VVSNCMQHVIVSDAVLAGCRLDVHATVYGQEYRSSTHVDDLCDEADRQMGTTVSARVGDAEDDRTHVSDRTRTVVLCCSGVAKLSRCRHSGEPSARANPHVILQASSLPAPKDLPGTVGTFGMATRVTGTPS